VCAYHQEDDAVIARSRSLLTAAAVLGIAPLLPGQEPARLGLPPSAALNPPAQISVNQQTATAIAERLRLSGRLRHYTVDIAFADGTAYLSGTVADAGQRAEVVRLVQGMPAVKRVADQLTVAGEVKQVQATDRPPVELGPPPPKTGEGVVVPGGPIPPGLPMLPNAPLPGGLPPGMGRQTDPMPLYQAPPMSPYDLNPPKMPPYAWPTYAPYDNYSRVGYPNLYPYNAFPFIGPIYPFPKIPLSWRKVSLEWKDGYWWYGPHGSSHDWWRLRYW
jgi:hypothetical protein